MDAIINIKKSKKIKKVKIQRILNFLTRPRQRTYVHVQEKNVFRFLADPIIRNMQTLNIFTEYVVL